MYKVAAAALFTVASMLVAAYTWPTSQYDGIDCDGYGNYCAYPVRYTTKAFVRDAVEQDTAARAAQAAANLAPPVKIPDRFAGN